MATTDHARTRREDNTGTVDELVFYKFIIKHIKYTVCYRTDPFFTRLEKT